MSRSISSFRAAAAAAVTAAAFVAVSPAEAQSGKPGPAAKTWKCAAAGLVNASYDGGDSAYVHLAGFPSGGTYPVTRTKAGTVATGTTANGTRFTCTAS